LCFKVHALLFKELRPFPKKNSLLLGGVVFFTRELFLLYRELAWDQHLVYFAWGNYFLKASNLKNYLNVL